jgi:predicted dehydrogenase
MRKNKLRIAIAGAGMVTRHHLIAWGKLPQVEVAAICARHLENARTRARESGIPQAYADAAEMLDREKPDVLDIATPPEAHARLALMAADRGIHILCQKPMSPTLPEAERLVASVGDRVRFMVHENWRFRPQYRQAASWLAEGRAGPVREFHLSTRSSGLVTRTDAGRPYALERQPFLAGLKRLIILELLIHHLDTVRFVVGPVKVVAAQTSRISPDIVGEDAALITLQAAQGAFGTVTGNFSAAGMPPLPQDRLEIVSERAGIVFENNVLRLTGEGSHSLRFDLEQAYQASYDNAVAHFVSALETGTPFETDRLDNLETLRLVDDAYRLAGR